MARGISRQLVVFACTAALCFSQSRKEKDVMKRITEDSLRANVTFLASDALEGRATPSAGLDKAADYIALQFSLAGLVPINGSYFQVAHSADFPRLRFPEGSTMRNVVGLLKGSDKKLSETYILISGHYDHVGLATTGDDRVFNGANDDASGAASVIELARALAKSKPKRSVVFMTFFGEERGLLGSRYYGAHPLVPIAQTIAQINLEQMGRTDASNGLQIKGANITGFDMSTLPATLADAAQIAGVRIWKDPQASDPFFSRSDNQSLADLGVPAHTMSVAYEFPDYHKVTDTAEKIDYANMAAVDRAIALGILRLASEAVPPQWSPTYAPAQKYAAAARQLHPGQ
jgi:Zn-dependent M28 family amino/carboxypeptidase